MIAAPGIVGDMRFIIAAVLYAVLVGTWFTLGHFRDRGWRDHPK